jgi:hypothetical protein
MFSCEKDTFSTVAHSPLNGHVHPIDYDLDALPIRDQFFINVAKAIGSEFRINPRFREQFFTKLTYSNGRSTKDYFVLDFINDDFNGRSGLDILSPKTTEGSHKSMDSYLSYFENEAPNAVFKMPKYVESFFWTEELINQDLSIFSGQPMAVFPETESTSASGTFIGYGDSLNTSNGIYSIRPGGVYDGYLPIHIKSSQNHVVLTQDNVIYQGDRLARVFSSHWSGSGIECLNSLIDVNTVEEEFLPGDLKLVDFAKLAAESANCRVPLQGEDVYFVPPSNWPPNGPTVWPPDGPRVWPINPPANEPEICDNGIDDDEDGLIDGDDPDCQTPPSTEICDNGIDDDNDGLIDEDDPNCLSCPESAIYPRDCREDFNRITGTKFRNVNYYSDIQGLMLPGIIDNVNLRFDMFFVNNIPGCDVDCPIGTDNQLTSSPMLIIFTAPQLLSSRRFRLNFDDQFEAFHSPGLDNGNPGHFIVEARPEGATPPQRGLLIGRIGEWLYERGPFSFSFELNAWLISTNWIPVVVPYMNVGAGEWYPTLYGNIIRMAVHEVDAFNTSLTVGSTTSTTNTSQINVSLASAIPNAFGITSGSTENPVLSPSLGYDFTNSVVKTASKSYTISSARIYDLGTFSLTYQDLSNDSRPVEDGWGVIQNSNIPGAVSTFSYGWGWGSSNLPAFYEGWNGKVNTPLMTSMDMIDLIRNQ